VFAALIFWNLFANSVITASTCLTGQASLISKQYFPRIILPTASVVARVVDLAFALVALGVLFKLYGVRADVHLGALALCLVLHLMFTLGFAYLVSSLNVLYRDVGQALNPVLMLWMYASPIFYGLNQVPENVRGYFRLNAIGILVALERTSVLAGGNLDLSSAIVPGIISLVTFIVGYAVFRKIEPLIAEVM